jgi:hypothetical protein
MRLAIATATSRCRDLKGGRCEPLVITIGEWIVLDVGAFHRHIEVPLDISSQGRPTNQSGKKSLMS